VYSACQILVQNMTLERAANLVDFLLSLEVKGLLDCRLGVSLFFALLERAAHLTEQNGERHTATQLLNRAALMTQRIGANLALAFHPFEGLHKALCAHLPATISHVHEELRARLDYCLLPTKVLPIGRRKPALSAASVPRTT
jgi:hypothetical protein